MSDFLHMGGYGVFIWASYGVSALVLVTLTVISLRNLKKIERELAPLEEARRDARRRGNIRQEIE
ncbi:heme exporter protein CcmD [Sneathiella glossodoripedis]|uniref:heme exporter protein CcmD n=1 Tax=Sneathiella glossodoripedis TaxID=418853 RepID=UPI00046F9E02|nr:heme exporter protein CcmD [Sneathiella glossodoripedis]